ncbi:MAG: polymer-forming cytoskeletal protein [Polyangiaceae bacterium]|jgi:cytoskeletal protein CcmA (bactofilin family)
MAANPSVIGRTTRVRGRITGDVDLDVQGFVDGEIAVGGDVTVDAQGMVGGGVSGRRLVIRGAVKGDLSGSDAIALEEGARVVGDVRAPRVAIAPGALVRGFVETGEGGAASSSTGARAQRAQPAARPAVAPPKAAPPPTAKAHVAPAAPPAAPSKPAEKAAPAPHAAGTNNAAPAGPRRPPPPVVPALKKAKGQIAKKKER